MNRVEQAIKTNGGETMNQTTIRISGWSAYANGILTLANMITISLMFAVNPAWGKVNDAVSVLWALSFLPLALLFSRVNRQVMGRGVAMGTAIAGAGAMLLFAGLQSLLAAGLVQFEQTFSAVVALGGIMGMWLLATGLLVRKGQTLPRGLAWLSIVFGFGYILGMVGYWLGGYASPFLWAGAAIGYVVGPVWAFWLGWLLLSGRAPMTAIDSGGSIQV
jgi:hypothetical protein